jgi:hypothetical protein
MQAEGFTSQLGKLDRRSRPGSRPGPVACSTMELADAVPLFWALLIALLAILAGCGTIGEVRASCWQR